jgi:hypothetical protein
VSFTSPEAQYSGSIFPPPVLTRIACAVDARPIESYAITNSTGSHASLSRVKDLLEKCSGHITCEQRWAEQNHRRCLPTRLVDLSMVAQKGTISVIEGTKLPATTEYMTLSHCWGSQPPPEAVWLSHDKLSRGLPIGCLPPTFRDACRTILSLDCYYVWIDALCILQGDEADWLRESNRMSDVFSMSALTIAASGSINIDAGLFRHR